MQVWQYRFLINPHVEFRAGDYCENRTLLVVFAIDQVSFEGDNSRVDKGAGQAAKHTDDVEHDLGGNDSVRELMLKIMAAYQRKNDREQNVVGVVQDHLTQIALRPSDNAPSHLTRRSK